MTLFATKLDTLSAKKMTSHIFFLGSYDSLPIEKMLTLHNVIINIIPPLVTINRKIKKTTRQIKFSVVTIKQQITLVL